MKKIIISVFISGIILCSCFLTACSGPAAKLVDEPTIDYGNSVLFTQEDMDAAINIIKEQMDKWGIEYNLQNISYAGDGMADKGMAYVATLTEGYDYQGCQVFLVDFVCLSKASGFEKNKLYEDWEWYIIKDEDGSWLFFTNGYISKYMLENDQ